MNDTVTKSVVVQSIEASRPVFHHIPCDFLHAISANSALRLHSDNSVLAVVGLHTNSTPTAQINDNASCSDGPITLDS